MCLSLLGQRYLNDRRQLDIRWAEQQRLLCSVHEAILFLWIDDWGSVLCASPDFPDFKPAIARANSFVSFVGLDWSGMDSRSGSFWYASLDLCRWMWLTLYEGGRRWAKERLGSWLVLKSLFFYYFFIIMIMIMGTFGQGKGTSLSLSKKEE